MGNVAEVMFPACSTILAFAGWLYKDYINFQLSAKGLGGSYQAAFNKYMVYLTFASGIGLAGLSSVNENQDNNIHVAFTAVFFLSYMDHVWVDQPAGDGPAHDHPAQVADPQDGDRLLVARLDRPARHLLRPWLEHPPRRHRRLRVGCGWIHSSLQPLLP